MFFRASLNFSYLKTNTNVLDKLYLTILQALRQIKVNIYPSWGIYYFNLPYYLIYLKNRYE